MREMISNFKIKKILLSILITVFIILAFNVKLYASVNKNNKELYEETNLYEYIGFDDNEYNKRKIRNEARYNLDNKSNNQNGWIVDEGAPLLTVITHGLGGSAADWSNNSVKYSIFSFSNESLITRLAIKEKCNIYLATYKNVDNVYTLRNITSEIYSGIKGNIVSFNYDNIGHITDISKHSIVIFEASDKASYGCNDDVYTEFNYAISNIVKDIKTLNGNKLPKINLIGHSRGGITNLQYALDHPDLVDSMYSLGTPYLGTTSGSLGYMIDKGALCSEEAANDLLNPEEYEKYMLRWNNGYYDYYKNINVNAYAGYITFDLIIANFLRDNFWNYKFNDYDSWNEYKKMLAKSISVELCHFLYSKLLFMTLIDESSDNDLIDFLGRYFQQLKNDSTKNQIIDFLRIFIDEITVEPRFPFLVFRNDVCVDGGSALGYKGNAPDGIDEYKGFKRRGKSFNTINCNMNALSRNMPEIPHNLEARDEELNKYIISDIKLGNNKDYLVKNVYDSDGNETNQVYIEEYVGNCAGETLSIPSSIEGKLVVGISDYAFANNCYGKNKIKNITIPDTVKHIGENAFYNSDYIEKINISENSSLEEIRRGAFSNIPNLKSLVIPNNVDYIDEGAFFNTPINSFQIKENNNYSWENNILINKNVTDKNNLIAIYANPDVSEIVIPDSVGIISASLFENNRNIKTINLNNVKHIGTKAFANSSLTNIIGGALADVEDYAFTNTPWLENQDSDFVTFGNNLISYTGSEKEVVIPEGITRICGNTFNSEEIEEIILPSTIEIIGDGLFLNCKNLKSILFTSSKPAILNGIIADGDVVFYVKDDSYEKYVNSVYYKNINNKIDVKRINVKFYDINDNCLGEKEELYGSSFDEFIEAPKIKGKEFHYWINQYGKELYKYSYLSEYNDLVLKPYYETSKCTINLDDNQKTTISLKYGEKVELDIPAKDGYEFIGLFDSATGGNKIVDIDLIVVWEELADIKELYAQYKLINYKITYETNDGVFINDNLKYTFNVENPITTKDIPEVRKFGYVFDYWLCGCAKFITTYGRYEDIKLEASYKGDSFNNFYNMVTINHEYSIYDLSNQAEGIRTVFTIANNAKTVTFKGNNKEFSNMRILIASRSDALVLGFEDIKFHPFKETSGKGLCAVECLSKCDIYISFKGNVEIVGGEGADGRSYYFEHNKATNNQNGVTGWNGQNGYDGGYGIRGDKIIFSQFDNESFIKVIGGRGGRGGRGENGQDGSDGVNSPSGSIWSPKKGDDGAKGGTGGRGGNGGNGAFGIYVSSSNNLLVSDAMNYRFYGGSGGDGGLGGTGGRGGNGASDTNASMFNGVGDPGNGGAGGLGGQGGNGGNGSTGSNALNVYGYGGIGGLRGAGNQGGAGGLGGNSGKNGDNGSNGKTGIMGVSGSSGVGGIDGYNVIGNELGIKNTLYVFNKDFIIHIFN